MQFHFMRHFSCFSLFTCFQLSPPSFPHFSGRTKATCWIHNLSTLVFTCLYIRFFKLYRELFDCFHFSSPSTATTKYKAILRKCFIPPFRKSIIYPSSPRIEKPFFDLLTLYAFYIFYYAWSAMCDFFLQEFKETLHFRFLFFLVRGVCQKAIQKTLQIHIFVYNTVGIFQRYTKLPAFSEVIL